MSKPTALPRAEIERLDQVYREGGLRAMASPHIHYDDATCPHAGCGHRMEWIDFKLELHGDPEGVYKPLVRAWWDGTGFVGHCMFEGGRYLRCGFFSCYLRDLGCWSSLARPRMLVGGGCGG